MEEQEEWKTMKQIIRKTLWQNIKITQGVLRSMVVKRLFKDCPWYFKQIPALVLKLVKTRPKLWNENVQENFVIIVLRTNDYDEWMQQIIQNSNISFKPSFNCQGHVYLGDPKKSTILISVPLVSWEIKQRSCDGIGSTIFSEKSKPSSRSSQTSMLKLG